MYIMCSNLSQNNTKQGKWQSHIHIGLLLYQNIEALNIGVECTRHFGNLPNVDDFIKKNDNIENLSNRPQPGPMFINI